MSEEKRLTMREAAKHLGVSISTVKRRISLGQYGKGQSSGEQSRVGEVTRTFTYADLGLDQDGKPRGKDVLLSDVAINGVIMPEPASEGNVPPDALLPNSVELRRSIDTIAPVLHSNNEDEDFATAYREGRACDSAGNYIDGHNPRWSSGVSLLGPIVVEPEPVIELQSHMSDVHFRNREPMLGADGEPVLSASDDRHPLNIARGFQPKPVRPLPQQRRKQIQDRATIHRAFLVRGI